MRLPTFSYLPVVAECAAAAVLPKVERIDRYAVDGTLKHKFLHTVRKAGREVALAQLPDGPVKDFCAALDPTQIPRSGVPEQSFAWNYKTDTARILGSGLNRDYSAVTEDEICGTVDLGDLFLDQAVVTDWKFGYQFVAPDSWQMKAAVLASARAHGADSAESNIVRLFDGKPKTFSAQWSAMDLDSIANDLTKMVKRIHAADAQYRERRNVDVRPGDHCDYCKCVEHCPAHLSMARVIAMGHLDKMLNSGEALDVAGLAWERTKEARRVLDIVENGIEQVARVSPVPLANGKILKEIAKRRESINPDIGSRVLVENYGLDALKASEPKITKASIKRHLKEKAEVAIELIRAAGGIEETVTTAVEEVDA